MAEAEYKSEFLHIKILFEKHWARYNGIALYMKQDLPLTHILTQNETQTEVY